MEKYIDRNSIVSLEIHEKKLYTEFFNVYRKPFKLFGFIPFNDGKSVYQTTPTYDFNVRTFNSIDEAYNSIIPTNKEQYQLIDNKVYRKPFVVMTDKDKKYYRTYFDDEKEMDEYIQSLDLDIVKKYVKIKYN
jgi:hypothetical protein